MMLAGRIASLRGVSWEIISRRCLTGESVKVPNPGSRRHLRQNRKAVCEESEWNGTYKQTVPDGEGVKADCFAISALFKNHPTILARASLEVSIVPVSTLAVHSNKFHSILRSAECTWKKAAAPRH